MCAHQVCSYGPSMTSHDHTTQRTTAVPLVDPRLATRYEVRVEGHLQQRWSAWLDGFALAPESDGITVISGQVEDQAALHGLLQKLRDIGIPMISLTSFPPNAGSADPHNHPSPPT